MQLALLWGAAFLLYAGTTARGVLPADSGEFQLIAAGWGIGHPPGYPLYTIASALWARLVPLGTLPFRVNLFSAVLAATTLTLLAEAVAAWAHALGASRSRSRIAGTAAALALGTAATFWAQATTANIRMPSMLFTVWGFLALARYRAAVGERARQDRALLQLALAIGLGIGHHPSLAFIATGWALYILLLTPKLVLQPARLTKPAALAFGAWLVPQLYLPLRGAMSDVPLNPSGLATWHGFWNHVLARGFGGDMFAFISPQDLALRLPLLPTLFRFQFAVVILIAMGAGWVTLLRRDARIAAALGISWIVQTFVTVTYRAPQTIEYLMPAYVPMALTLGLALALLPDGARSSHKHAFIHLVLRIVTVIVFVVLLAQLPGHVRDFAELNGNPSIHDRVAPLLEQAPPGATILADWRWATPLWVLQATTGTGTDVQVTYVTPEEDRAYEDVWRSRAEQASDQPLLTTHVYDWEGWTFAPVGGGFRLYRQPLTALPDELGLNRLDADLGPVRLLGYRWIGEPRPGSTLELQLAWQAQGSQTPAPSFATRLWGPDGSLVSAADRNLGSTAQPGEVRFARLTHQMHVTACAGEVVPDVGAYTTEDGAFQDLGSVSLPALPVECRYPRLPSNRPWPGFVALEGPFLRGVDYDTQADGTTTAYLHWCGPGKSLLIQGSEGPILVEGLALGACRTVRVPNVTPTTVRDGLSRLDGTPATYVGLPLPEPRAGERYLPFGDEMILVNDHLSAPEKAPTIAGTLTLRWLTAKPLLDDYAVSVRYLDDAGRWLGIHDMQPGLGALPTLKWVSRGNTVRDPHPLVDLETRPAQYTVVVYERFRMTPLKSLFGDTVTYDLP